MKRAIIGILLLSVAFACDDTNVNASKTQLITSSKWLFDGATSTDPDIGTLLPLLSQSNYQFSADHTYRFTMLGIAQVGTWEFSTDEAYIILGKGTADERTLKINRLDPAKFEFEEFDGTNTTSYYYVKTT